MFMYIFFKFLDLEKEIRNKIKKFRTAYCSSWSLLYICGLVVLYEYQAWKYM